MFREYGEELFFGEGLKCAVYSATLNREPEMKQAERCIS